MPDKKRFRYDAVVKDLFQKDRPTLLGQLADGAEVREFLNNEFAVVEERVADLLVLLSDGSILHLDFQSNNHRDMPFRVGIYGILAAQKYRKIVRQVVIYMGAERMRMQDHLDLGQIQIAYRLVDIREFEAGTLIESGNPGDLALAMLARGGVRRMREIVRKANALPEVERQRVLTQMVILAGLRGVSEGLTMELKNMGVYVEIEKNVFLKELRDSALAQGKAEGMGFLLQSLLESKFGPLPKWAVNRVQNAAAAHVETWAPKVLKSDTLEEVIGKR